MSISAETDLLAWVLARFIRVLTLDQAVAHGLATGSQLRGVLNRHQRQGTLAVISRPVCLLESLDAPLAEWGPGMGDPDLEAVSQALHQRWRGPVRTEKLIYATRVGGNLFGLGPGRAPRESDLSHDVAMGEVFLRHYLHSPEALEHWRREDVLPAGLKGRGRATPDAYTIKDGRALAVELGGQYRVDKLWRFHDYCEAEGLAYEVW